VETEYKETACKVQEWKRRVWNLRVMETIRIMWRINNG